MVVVVYPEEVIRMHFCSNCGVFCNNSPAEDPRYDYVLHRLHDRRVATMHKLTWNPYRYIRNGMKVRPQAKAKKNT